MATVKTTLELFDAFTRPLSGIMQEVNKTISAMNNLRGAMEKPLSVAKNFDSARKKILHTGTEMKSVTREMSHANEEMKKGAEIITSFGQVPVGWGVLARTEAGFRSVTAQIRQAEQAQKELNKSIEQGEKNANQLATTIRNLVAAYLSFEGIKRIGQATIGAAMQQQEMLDAISARVGNETLGRAIYDQIVKQALRYGQDVQQALGGSLSFLSATMDPRQLKELNRLAMRLQKLNPAEGFEGAAFAMKELLSGDYTSIAERFNISRSLLQEHEARLAGMRGDVEGFIRGMDKLLDQQNMTEKAFEKMLDSPAAKWNRLIQTFKYELAEAGQAGLAAFVPLIDLLNRAFETGQMQSFFNVLSISLTIAAQVITWFVQGAFVLMNILENTYPIVLAVAGAFGAYYATLWFVGIAQRIVNGLLTVYRTIALMAASAQLGLNLVMLQNPIAWFVGLLTGLIIVLLYLIATFENVRESVAYSLERLGGSIAKFVGFAIDLWESFINFVINRLNFLLGVINEVVNAIGGLIGWSPINLRIKNVDFSGFKRTVQSGITGTFGKAAQAVRGFSAENIKKALNNMTKGFQPNLNVPQPKISVPTPDIGKVGKVGSVGKIEDTVDISSEDLKVMRELAEMKSIQNFVTLTPTVQVTTGDIRTDADIDTIIRRIEEALEREIAIAAQGVYG